MTLRCVPSVSVCDGPLTGIVDAVPGIVGVAMASRRAGSVVSTLAGILRDLTFPETPCVHNRHHFSHEKSSAAYH